MHRPRRKRNQVERLEAEKEALRGSLEESEARRRALEEENERLRERGKQLEERGKQLEERLARLEGSPGVLALSDKTAEAAGVPSSKTYYRRPTQPGPDGTNRTSGGQPGHTGRSRHRPTPNQPPVLLTLDQCPTTGQALGEPADWLGRTITDLPSPTVDIHVELRARYRCPCGERHVAQSHFPAYQQWGPNLVSFVVHHRMLALSVAKIQALLWEQYHLRVSEAALLGMEAHVAALLGPRYEEIRARVRASVYVGADETSLRVGGDNGWLWTFSAIDAVLYEADKSRSASVPLRVLEGFTGVLGRDAWDPYDRVECEAHQLDPVHVNRWLERAEVKNGVEPRPLLRPVPAKVTRRGRPPEELLRFCDGVRGLLREAVAFATGEPPPGNRKRVRAYKSYRRRLKRHVTQSWRHPDAVRIAKELRSRLDMVFTFVRIAGVPWHNNDAELQIRAGVLHRKTSGGRRSRAGANVLARLLSVYQTCKKTGENFNAIVRDVYARAASRPSPIPSIAPQS